MQTARLERSVFVKRAGLLRDERTVTVDPVAIGARLRGPRQLHLGVRKALRLYQARRNARRGLTREERQAREEDTENAGKPKQSATQRMPGICRFGVVRVRYADRDARSGPRLLFVRDVVAKKESSLLSFESRYLRCCQCGTGAVCRPSALTALIIERNRSRENKVFCGRQVARSGSDEHPN